MYSDEVKRYRQVKANLENTQKTIERYVRTITRASGLLEDWKHVIIENAGVKFPITGSGKSIDANEWPAGKELAQTLANWHQTSRALQDAYNLLSEEDKKRVEL